MLNSYYRNLDLLEEICHTLPTADEEEDICFLRNLVCPKIKLTLIILNVTEFILRSLDRGKLSTGAHCVWKLSLFLTNCLEKSHTWHFLHNLLTSVYDLQDLLSSSTKNRRTWGEKVETLAAKEQKCFRC